MLVRRMSATLLLAATALLATAAPALAHTELESSNPAKDASVATPPTQVVLTFSEPVTLPAGAVAVAGPNGVQWTIGQPTVAGAVVTAPVTPAGPAGVYTITYKIISEDGDPVSGTVPFTLTTAVPTSTTTTPPPTTTSSPTPAPTQTAQAQPAPVSQQSNDSGGIPVWVWIVGGVVVLGAGLFIGLRAGRGKSAD